MAGAGKKAMKAQDLLELWQLLEMYRGTYGEEGGDSLEGCLEGIRERYKEETKGEDIQKGRNPRKAGRKRIYTKEENAGIRQLHSQGLSIREIGRRAGCSIGHVQDVIKESKMKD